MMHPELLHEEDWSHCSHDRYSKADQEIGAASTRCIRLQRCREAWASHLFPFLQAALLHTGLPTSVTAISKPALLDKLFDVWLLAAELSSIFWRYVKILKCSASSKPDLELRLVDSSSNWLMMNHLKKPCWSVQLSCWCSWLDCVCFLPRFRSEGSHLKDFWRGRSC